MKIFTPYCIGLALLLVIFSGFTLQNQCSISEDSLSLKVMTYNIRYDNPADGDLNWNQRKVTVTDIIKAAAPDILGVQEALVHQVNYIEKKLSGYSWVGNGRDDGKMKGEYAALFYKTSVFTLANQGKFWISQNPKEVGSIGWDATLPRIATWAQLINKNNGKVFFVFNTHLDHEGELSRIFGVDVILNQIKEIAGNNPVILMGDFNMNPEDESYYLLSAQLRDAKLQSPQYRETNDYTYRGFEVGKMEGKRIDYIFISKDFKVDKYKVIDFSVGSYYPSDHLPVVINLTW